MTFVVVGSLTPGQVDDLMDLYQFTYWAKARSKEDVQRMLAESHYLFGVADKATGRLCAFARIISDNIYRSVVLDVVVHPDLRGKGLTRMIFDAIFEHPLLGKVECTLLYCKDDVLKLYERFGFEVYDDVYLMRRMPSDQKQ
jgi:predicted GNAT family N-acyltransferase